MLGPTAMENNAAVYAQLRALHLDARETALLSLAKFTSLVYLAVRLDSKMLQHNGEAESELIEALSYIPHLRVLMIHGGVLAGLVCALPQACPQLEHLSLPTTYRQPATNEWAALARMGSLISLAISDRYGE